MKIKDIKKIVSKTKGKDIKKLIWKIREPYDERKLFKCIDKLANAIWKYAFQDSIEPKYTKEDAMDLSIAIHWNDVDTIKEILLQEGRQ